jgi:Cof subfamily protein (haloacid dehalogenase superfamily)
MDMKVSLIVSDIDGTLLPAGCRQDGTEPDGPGVSDGIRHLGTMIQKLELPFTLASGRPLDMMELLGEHLGITLPMVACNGAAVGGKKGLLWSDHLNTDQVRTAIECADHLNMAIIATDGSDEVVYRQNDYTRSRSRNGSWTKTWRPACEEDWQNWRIQKLLIIDPASPGKVDEVICELNRNRKQEELSILRYDDRGIEVMPGECTKGMGVKRLAQSLGIPMDEVMVLGDNKNDIDMFRAAGLGAAVGNAVSALKEEADYVSHEKWVYGVIEALEALNLPQRCHGALECKGSERGKGQ